jgi:hypothetical protein
MATTPEDKNESLLGSLERAAMSNINNIGEIVKTIDNAASSMLRQFGQGQAMADILRASMSDSVTSVRRLGGDIADVLQIQEQASNKLGRNIILSEETTKDLYATMKVTNQEVTDIVENMANAGISSGKAAGEMKKVVDIARESGVNAQKVSGMVLENMQALNKYNFEGGVQGLAKMAAQATSLRIDMSQTLEFAEKVFNPEGAIEVAAAMQRLGVSQSSLLDPLKLMDLSQNDPAELQNQIAEMSKQFVQLGKDGHFEIMPGAKRQLREISSAMGISYDQITKMALGSADLDKKMKEITFPSATEDQKKMIANMAEMGKGGTYEIKTAAGVTKDVSTLTGPELEALEKIANTAPKTMEELAKEQLSATQSVAAAINSLGDRTGLALAGSATGGRLLTGGREIATSLSKVPGEGLESKNLRKKIDEGVGGLMGILDDYAKTGKSTVSMSDAMGGFTDFFKKEFVSSFSNLQKEADRLNTLFPIFGNIADAAKRSVGIPVTNSTTNVPRATTGTLSNTQSSTTSSTMDVNLSHTINITAPPGIDTKTFQDALNNPDVKQQIVTTIKETMSNANFGPILKKNEALPNPGY